MINAYNVNQKHEFKADVNLNKYLFQYARKKGFDMKFTKTFKQTLDELLEMEREMMN